MRARTAKRGVLYVGIAALAGVLACGGSSSIVPANWSEAFYGIDDSGALNGVPVQVRVGPDGELLLSGGLRGTVQFGTVSLTAPTTDGSGSRLPESPFLVALDSAGKVRWARVIAGAFFGRVAAIDPDQGIFFVGCAVGTIDLGDGPRSVGNFPWVGLIAQYHWDGSLGQVRIFPANTGVQITALAPTPDGKRVITGVMEREARVDLGGGVTVTADPNLQSSAFVAELDETGNALWARTFSGSATDSIHQARQELSQVALDGSGRLHLLGSHQYASIDLGGGALPGPPGDVDETFVGILGPDGSYLSASDLAPISKSAFASDSSGASVICGLEDADASVAGLAVRAGQTLCVRVTADGTPVHPNVVAVHGVGAYNPVGIRSLALDASGNAVGTSEFTYEIKVGGFPLKTADDSTLQSDVFAFGLDASDQVTWARSYGGLQNDVGTGIAVTPDHLYLAGWTNGALDLGNGQLPASPDAPKLRSAWVAQFAR